MNKIYIGRAARLWNCDIRTVDKYIKSGTLKIVEKDPLGHRLLNEDQVIRLLRRLKKRRKKGESLLDR